MGLFLGGIQFRHAAAILLVAGVLMPTLWIYGHCPIKPYQKDRLTSFLHPEADSQKTGYQLEQSKIAVGRAAFGAKEYEKARKHRGRFFLSRILTLFLRPGQKSTALWAQWPYCCYTSWC